LFTGKEIKSGYALRWKAKHGKAVASQKKGDGPLHSIVVDGNNADSDSCTTDKSENHMKHNHVRMMEDELAKKKVTSSLQCSVVGASNANAEVGEKVKDMADVGIRKRKVTISSGRSPSAVVACPSPKGI